MNGRMAEIFLKELEAEAPATRKCLERIPADLSDWKPHEKSMALGYLALLVADIPRWITFIVETGEIDFATYPHFKAKSTEDLVRHFDENMKGARSALAKVTDEKMTDMFYLKNNGVHLYSQRKDENISSTINHWVHHRGQLTVYMRQNNIPVPSIYGPSADDRSF
ncbi:MAG TPA: DinB family protein [Cyclobacteriaceae bacterium]|nr:DinB family protein [Cyclobacteriaceae bacterium]